MGGRPTSSTVVEPRRGTRVGTVPLSAAKPEYGQSAGDGQRSTVNIVDSSQVAEIDNPKTLTVTRRWSTGAVAKSPVSIGDRYASNQRLFSGCRSGVIGHLELRHRETVVANRSGSEQGVDGAGLRSQVCATPTRRARNWAR